MIYQQTKFINDPPNEIIPNVITKNINKPISIKIHNTKNLKPFNTISTNVSDNVRNNVINIIIKQLKNTIQKYHDNKI